MNRAHDEQSGLEVPRMGVPSVEQFQSIEKVQHPVIMGHVFDDAPIAEMRTLADVVERLGDVELAVSQEYSHNDFESQRDGYEVPDKRMTLAEYARYVEKNPSTCWLCVEQPTPEKVRALYRAPAFVEPR